MVRFWIGLLILAGLPSPLLGQPVDLQSKPDFDSTPDALDGPVLSSVEGPVLSAVEGPILPPRQQHWPGATVIAILGIFLSAAVIGPIVIADKPADTEEFNRSTEALPPDTP